MYFRINFFSFARATSNNYRRNLLLSSSPSSSRYFTRNLRKSSQTERQHTTPHRSFWCKDVVRLHVALLNVPMNRISQFLTSRKLGLSFPLLLNQTYVHRDPRGLLFTPTASLKLLRPIFRNSGAYLASQNPIWLNRRFSTGTEPPKTDEKIPKYEIIQKKELPSLGFPTQRKVYNDPNNIVLPGYNAGNNVSPGYSETINNFLRCSCCSETATSTARDLGENSNLGMHFCSSQICSHIPHQQLLLLILVLILCLEYVFFMLEPQLREAARLEELRNITARKQLESSPSLATIAVEEKPSASKGASADEPQIDPQMLKKIEQVLSFSSSSLCLDSLMQLHLRRYVRIRLLCS